MRKTALKKRERQELKNDESQRGRNRQRKLTVQVRQSSRGRRRACLTPGDDKNNRSCTCPFPPSEKATKTAAWTSSRAEEKEQFCEDKKAKTSGAPGQSIPTMLQSF